MPNNPPRLIRADRAHLHTGALIETDTHAFCGEASSLGMPPGYWPHEVYTDLGNAQPFRMVSVDKDSDGDIQGCRYMQAHGCISLRIIND